MILMHLSKMNKMKKIAYILPLLMAMLFVACASDDYVGTTPNATSLTFSGVTNSMTRSTPADDAAKLGSKFYVYATKGTGDAKIPVFIGDEVVYDGQAGSSSTNTNGWEYVGKGTENDQLIRYWDTKASQYDFMAYSFGQGVDGNSVKEYATITPAAAGNILSSLTISGNIEKLATVYISDKYTRTPATGGVITTEAVKLQFRSLLAKVRVGFYETIPGYSVKDVVFYTADGAKVTADADKDMPVLYANADSPVMTSSGDHTFTADYMDALSVTANLSNSNAGKDLKFTVLKADTYSDKLNEHKVATTDKTDKIYLGRTPGTFTHTENITVLPIEGAEVGTTAVVAQDLHIKVDYTLVPIDDASGHKITVKGATAIIPAQYATWKSNFAYTYIFKIDDNTNGTTGGAGDRDPAGLYPITFDECDVIDRYTGQGTATTFGPNGTTYPITVDGVTDDID